MSYFGAITQDVQVDDNNSSVVNLAAGATFSGVASSTLGVVGLQWSLYTTQNCTVYIDQSPDGTNWDISDSFDYIYSEGGDGGTVQALNSYWRIRVTNNGLISTTAFRLQGILCPIADPLPRTLSRNGNLQTETSLRGAQNPSRHVWVNPTNELAVSPVYRLVGTNFDGSTKDTNFWTDNSTVSGTVTQDGGEVELETGTGLNSRAIYKSVREARFVTGSAMYFAGGFNYKTAATSGNVRRLGAYDDNNGFFMQLSGTTFSVGSRKSTVDSLVSAGSFNGYMGSDWMPVVDTYYNFAIEYTPLTAAFYVNGSLLHTKPGAHQSDYMTLPITLENTNDGISDDINFESVGVYIARQGELVTNPTSKYITAAATYVCKVGPGVLRRIVINNPGAASTALSIYDNPSGVGNLIGIMTLGTKAVSPASIEYGLPFNDGLTIISTGTWDATVVYE